MCMHLNKLFCSPGINTFTIRPAKQRANITIFNSRSVFNVKHYMYTYIACQYTTSTRALYMKVHCLFRISLSYYFWYMYILNRRDRKGIFNSQSKEKKYQTCTQNRNRFRDSKAPFYGHWDLFQTFLFKPWIDPAAFYLHSCVGCWR